MTATTIESNRIRFTKAALRDLAPPDDRDRYYVYDTHPASPQGFALCVTQRGLKTFYLVGRVNGRPKRETLGVFAKPGGVGEGMTVEQARDKAQKMTGRRADGIDTFDEAQRQRRQLTFGETFERFITAPTPRRKRPKSEKTVYEYRNQYDLYLKPWAGLRLMQVSRGMVRKLHDKIASDDGKPTMANRVVGLVRSVFNHAITREDAEVANPALGFERAEETPRDRRLSADELPRFMQAVNADDRAVMADALKLALYTGQRCGNVLAAEWAEVDLTAHTWTIPEGKTKTRREYVVYLAPQVVAILSRRKLKAEDHAYVFPGRRHGRNLTTLRYIVNDACTTAKIDPAINVHDLRRTAESIAGDTGCPEKYLNLITNHESGAGMAKVYNRPDAELARRAFCILADAIDATIAGEPLPQWINYMPKRGRKAADNGK